MQLDQQTYKDHIRFIEYWAIKNYPLQMYDDLVQEGCIGLIQALKTYDAIKSSKLLSYAGFFIKSQMSLFYQKNKHRFEELNEDQVGSFVDYTELTYKNQLSERLNRAILMLDDREKDIIQNRYLVETPLYLHVLASKWNISKQRVLQLEEETLKILKKQLTLFNGEILDAKDF